MKDSEKTRRGILKQAGLAAAGLAGAACSGRRTTTVSSLASRLPELMRTGVLVVGGGPAGLGAALGAARSGVETLLIESYGFFGGVGAWSLGMPINQVRPGAKPRSHVHELLVEKLRAYGDQAVKTGEHALWCNVEYLKAAALDALDETACRYLVHLRAVDAVTDGGRVTGVIVATKNGLATIRAKAVVDCTGDADIAYFSGAETLKETGNLSPSTLALGFTNVTAAQLRAVKMREVAARARAKYPLIPAEGWSLRQVSNSESCWYVNHSGTREFGQIDTTDPVQRSEAECKSRRQAVQMAQAMGEYGGEALKDVELFATGPQMGIRESRRIKGTYVLTEADALEGRKFEDAIAWRSGFLDIGFTRLSEMKIHDVPYRCLVPEKVDGLLAAGRCISASHVAASAGKSMGNCMATGHAAGLAASVCARRGIQPREVNVAQLQQALREDGVDLTMGGKGQGELTTESSS